MQDNQSASGMASQLDSVSPDLPTTVTSMPLFDSRPVLWKNISALMHKKYGRENLNQLAREAKFGPATASRIKAQDTSVGIEVIDRVATVLGVHPWQLLYEDFNPEFPSNSANLSPLALDLAQQLEAIPDQTAREKAHALATQVLLLAAASIAAPPSPEVPPTQQPG